MKEPKRYRIQINESDVWSIEQFEHYQGEFVKATDYYKLATENLRLRRLADAMAEEFKFIGGSSVQIWNAKKDGDKTE